MINVTEYLKEKGLYNKDIIRSFLKLERVKYFIGNEIKIESKTGRYNSYTKFSEDLFEWFLIWIEKKPLPLLNRKEYEVSEFINKYFQDSISQHKISNYIFDWFIPCFNLLIEFNEKTHNNKGIVKKDYVKSKSIGSMDLFVINEDSVMTDLAAMCIKYNRHN